MARRSKSVEDWKNYEKNFRKEKTKTAWKGERVQNASSNLGSIQVLNEGQTSVG